MEDLTALQNLQAAMLAIEAAIEALELIDGLDVEIRGLYGVHADLQEQYVELNSIVTQ